MHILWQPQTFSDMFHLALPVAEKMLRPIIVYAFLVLALRLFGKRELTSLNPFDLVVLLTLSNTVQNAIIGDDNSVTGGVIGAFTLLAVNYFTVRMVFKHRKLDRALEGSPTVLIENGKVNKECLAQELLTEEELLTVVHRQGFANLGEVDRCVLEPGGTFFVQGKVPASDQLRHGELLARIEELSRQIAQLARSSA